MIANKIEMRALENASSYSHGELMETAAQQIATQICNSVATKSRLLFLAGNGNNGGDAFAVCRMLCDEYACMVYLADGKPKTPLAKKNYTRLDKSLFIAKKALHKAILDADVIIDGVYGIGFHDALPTNIRSLFSFINANKKTVLSIDINSGANCDTGQCDPDTIISETTYALGAYKPFHLLRKDHQKFHSCMLLPLPIEQNNPSTYFEMNEEIFFKNFPHKPENAYKGIYGKTLLISGCWGMAGAACLNIIGAQTVGASYINVAVPEEIYTIAASKFLSPVFHPFTDHSWYDVIEPLIDSARAIGYGSGAVYMPHKQDILDLILQNSNVPIVLDAEALRLLKHNTYILRFAKAPVILTPHVGEFSYFTGKPIEVIMDNKIEIAKAFAKENHCIVVLKGPHTIVASPSGNVYINQTGNQSLAQAGSGDVLTGIMTAMLSMTSDVFTAVCMSVWLHGYLVDISVQNHRSMQTFRLETMPQLMDDLFSKHGY